MAGQESNTYLDRVVAQQAMLEEDLKVRPAAPMAAPPPARDALSKRGRALGAAPQAPQAPSNAVDVRITGVWRWKTVLVPPNAFVVHTRRGKSAPLHLGLGVSFRFNPATDAFLVVPGATQTILINAYCICRELQGVLVQGYVQWIIQDFAHAYRVLDFSDSEDPMRLVNIQLKEQAEAAIKDKVATMSVHDVLSDKQPIIEELTARLRGVAEGGDGLGLRIVTVQIKEAVVSSSRLWENLQKPYRAAQGRIARLAELEAEEVVSEREMAAARLKETRRIEHERELAELRARNSARQFDTETAEQLRRTSREHDDRRQIADLEKESVLHDLALERERHAEEAVNARLRRELALEEQEGQLAVEFLRAQNAHEKYLLDIERDRQRADIANGSTDARLQLHLFTALPEIVAKLPKPDELRTVNLTGNDPATISGMAAELTAVVNALKGVGPSRE